MATPIYPQLVTLAGPGPDATPIPFPFVPSTTDPGFSRYRNAALLATAVSVKASAGNVYGIKIINPNATKANVKLYNIAAASVTVGTSAVLHTVPVPANDGTNDGVTWITPDGIIMAFDTAIAIAAVTELADNGTTAPGSGLLVEIFYK